MEIIYLILFSFSFKKKKIIYTYNFFSKTLQAYIRSSEVYINPATLDTRKESIFFPSKIWENLLFICRRF